MDVQRARDIEALIPNLRRFAWVLVRDADRADDLVQDCLERAISREDRFEPGTNLRAWLFTILVNLVRSQARRAKVRGTVVSIEDYRDLISTPAGQDDALRVRDFKRAFAKLPKPFQEVLVVVAVEGFSYDEAAAVLDVPVGTVRSRLSRARDQLKQMVDETSGDARQARRIAARASRQRQPATVPARAAAAAG